MANNPELQMLLPGKLGNLGNIAVVEPPLFQVLLNAFRLDFKNVSKAAYLFHLEFFAEVPIPNVGPNGTQMKPLMGEQLENDVEVQIRRRLHWALFELLFQVAPGTFNPARRCFFIYDCAQLMFCTNPLKMNPRGEQRFQISQPQLGTLPAEVASSGLIRGAIQVMATLKRTEVAIDLQNRQQIMATNYAPFIQFLELLTTQQMHRNNSHLIFGNKMFKIASRLALGNLPYELKAGQQKNARLVGDSLQNAHPIIQIGPKKAAFFASLHVHEFLGRQLGLNLTQLTNQLQQQERIHQEANRLVKGLVLVTTHLPDRQLTFRAFRITREMASQLTFNRQDQVIRVDRYFLETYPNVQFHANLPCVVRQFRGQEQYYPLQVMKIVPGQRVPLGKQGADLVREMIRQCQILPAQMEGAIQAERQEADIRDQNPFMAALGIRVENTLIKADAHRLLPPAIQFAPAQMRIEPNNSGDMNWRFGRGQNPRYIWPTPWFPAKHNFAAVVVNNCVRDEDLDRFLQRLVQDAQRKGINNAGMPGFVEHWDVPHSPLEYVRERHSNLWKKDICFLLMIAPGKDAAYKGDIHHCIKLLETNKDLCPDNGILTQHISPKIMQKAISPGGGAVMVMDNLLFKMNLKMGGANYDLVTAQVMRQRSGNSGQDIVKKNWLRSDRMFFGMDFSHAAPNAPKTRKNRKDQMVPAIPTVVGMAWTLGDEYVLRSKGTYWYQTPRLAIANDGQCRPLIDKIKKALRDYQAENEGRFPQEIIVYRSGSSEGEFQKVAYWEGQQSFVAAICELVPQLENRPKICIVVCQSRSNYRVIPAAQIDPKAAAPQQNLQPGTVVDRQIMHPGLTEFLLIGQKALQGTSQPLRCTVVWTCPSSFMVPLLELEYVTYNLCYAHGICAGSIAVPAPLRAATELAKRGRNNLNTFPHRDMLEYPGEDEEEDPDAAQEQFDERLDDHFRMLSEQLEPMIPTKFWA